MGGVSEIIGGVGDMAMGTVGAMDEIKALEIQRYRERQAAIVGARQAQDEGAFQQGQIRAAGSTLAAEQAAAYTDSGVDSSTGTAAQVQANTQMKAELDAQQAKNNAFREVWKFQQMDKQAGENDEIRRGAWLRKSEGTVLGGAGRLAGGLTKLGGGT